MSVIAIVNPKGGSGKSTLATHVAAYAAQQGMKVMLDDMDRQKSSQLWLRERAEQTGAAPIAQRFCSLTASTRPPQGVTVIDSPGGLRDLDLARLVMVAEYLLMPVSDSLFDRNAAQECWTLLRHHPRVQSGRLRVAAVGMRVDGRTNAEAKIRAWANDLELPFLGALRQTQLYAQCCEQGLTVFDLPESKTQIDRAQWQPVIEWLAPAFAPSASLPEATKLPVAAANATSAVTGVNVAKAQPHKPQPAVWQELATALTTDLTPKRSTSGVWRQRLAQLFGGARHPTSSTAFEPSQMAAG